MKTLIVTSLIAAAAASSQAALIAQYTFAGASPLATNVDANVTANPFLVTNGAISGTTNAAYIPTSNTASTQNAALDGPSYFNMHVEAAPGYTLNLESIVFDYGSYANGASFNYSVYLQSDPLGLGSGSSVIFTNSLASGSGTIMNTDQLVSLAGSEYQDITAITLRWSYSDSINVSGSNVRLDNVRLNGTVTAIPEPSQAIAFLGLTSLVALLYVRRRRSKREQ
ncbi:hypothetical protein [Cerasicoccus fimbriatus]|uniref:hypothetical protein n=1 Tax=Cerasicoccus fimbriatus TaxID=3014554 RepID=UPI0022B5BC4F|nr:hypothetical protein [Cerasicoccus sp. TK19100]